MFSSDVLSGGPRTDSISFLSLRKDHGNDPDPETRKKTINRVRESLRTGRKLFVPANNFSFFQLYAKFFQYFDFLKSFY